MKKNLLLYITVVFGLCVSLTGCPFGSSQPGGIRVSAQEEIAGIGNSDFPVPGASYNGSTFGPPGPNSVGTEAEISGVTGAFGYSDNPSAITDIDWHLQGSMANVIPECGEFDDTIGVPPQGASWTMSCLEYIEDE